jgi:hypothetical protein
MAKTFNNTVSPHEVSIAIEHLYVGPEGFSLPAAASKIDYDNYESTLTNFTHLGAVVEDTPAVSIQREKYMLETGIPRVLQYDAVLGMSGQISCAFYSMMNTKVAQALGAAAALHSIKTGTEATCASTDTMTRTSIVHTAADASAANTLAGLIGQDDVVVIDYKQTKSNMGDLSGPSLDPTSGQEYWKTSGNTATVSSVSVNAAVVTINFKSPGFPVKYTLSSGNTVTGATGAAEDATDFKFGVVDGSRAVFGESIIPKVSIVGVADFVDGMQVQHVFPKCAATGEFQENIQPGSTGVIQAAWDLYGTTSNIAAPYNNSLILGERRIVHQKTA